jgi:pimeloyl-ACP methyl ester carboxylesterase
MPEFVRDGFTTFYAEAGDTEAPAVVLLHGFTSDNRMWLPVAGMLSVEYRLIAPDMRGHGATAAPEDPSAYTIEAYAQDLKDLLDHLEVDLCAIAGCSFGGMVALQFATTWPERLAGLVLSDTSAAYDHPDYDDKYRRREERIDTQCDIVERFGTDELGKRAAKDIADPFLAEGLRKRYARMSRDGFLGAARVRRERANLLPILRERLTMPVMVCIGDEDPVFSATEVMLRELPEARHIIFKGTGHGIPALRPEAYAREVQGFFDALDGEGSIAEKRTVG